MDPADTAQQVEQVREYLGSARRILCITGAGISADSGLPTYRGIGGLYSDGPTEDGIPIEEAISGAMLRHRPDITWKYLSQIECVCRGAGYNDAHAALAALQEYRDVCVLTQNIDGFHRAAGSRNVIEIHGCFGDLECMGCRCSKAVADYAELALPPRCAGCGEILRPKVVLFGEMLPEDALEHYYAELGRGFDLVISIGTTSVFPYIAAPVIEASRKGVPTVEINPGDSEVSQLVDVRIRERAAVILPALVASLRA